MERPLLKKPSDKDIEELQYQCTKYINELVESNVEWAVTANDIFAKAMEMFYGKEIWDYLND